MTVIDDFISWLDTHTNLERERASKSRAMNLDAINALCDATGRPERVAPCVHVAGSKGKGSMCKMTACILDAHGLKAGLYLSPHVSDFRERVGWAAGYFTDEIYNEAASEVMAAEAKVRAQGVTASWFELVTLFAFICFRLAKTEVNVIEVGIGGRLDATNVVRPAVTAIMPIELEHTAWLGNTIGEIAREKAGIIKPGVPVVAAMQPYSAAMQVIEDRAQEMGSPLIKAAGAIHVAGMMAGEHMARNAVAAKIAASLVCPNVTEADIEKGLEGASLPARFECFNRRSGRVIVDGAHTVSSIRAMLETMQSLEMKTASLVFGCASDKDVEDMAVLLSRYPWRRVVLTVPGVLPRADLGRTARAFQAAGVVAAVEGDCTVAIHGALSSLGDGTLVVCGSFYLAAVARDILIGEKHETDK